MSQMETTKRKHADKAQRLDELLAVNGDLNKACFLPGRLKAAFQGTGPNVLFDGLKRWLRLAGRSEVGGFLEYAKTIRRQACGFGDSRYFFRKIMEAVRRFRLRCRFQRMLCWDKEKAQ
jgi:hypothetical protein